MSQHEIELDTFEMLKHYKLYRNNRILVVDDEEFCIASINTIFKILEIDSKLVDNCIHGQEALDKVKEA